MKRFLALFIALLVCVFTAIPAFALEEAPYITDSADIFSSSDESKLTAKIIEVREKYNCDVGVYTVDFFGESISDGEARDFAEDYYNSSGFADNGILLMIYFAGNGNGWHIATAGECIDAFTDDDLDYIEDNFYSYLKNGDYSLAAESFVSDCENELHDFYTFDGIWFIIAPAIGIIIALISVNAMKSELKSIRSKPHASDYMKYGSMNLTASNDVFLYRQVTKTPIPKNTSSGGSSHRGGGGRSFGGSGGRF